MAATDADARDRAAITVCYTNLAHVNDNELMSAATVAKIVVEIVCGSMAVILIVRCALALTGRAQPHDRFYASVTVEIASEVLFLVTCVILILLWPQHA